MVLSTVAGVGLMACNVAAVEATTAPPRSLTATASDLHPPSPNIVLYIMDDLGFNDTGMTLPGNVNPKGSTPFIDQLSREATVFTEATSSPNCSPTRASLITGTQGTDPNNRIFNVLGLNKRPEPVLLRGPQQGQASLGHKDHLPASAMTIGENLKFGGYTTAAFGKFQLARTPEQMKMWHGFDETHGSSSAGHPGSYTATEDGKFHPYGQGGLDEFASPYTPEYVNEFIRPYSNGVSEEELDALTGQPKNVLDATADATDQYIAKQAAPGSKPFFMHVGSYAVHFPIDATQARQDLRNKYGAINSGKRDENTPRAYQAVLEGADQSLARLVHSLKTTPDPRNDGKPMSENTLLFLTSDNGGDLVFGADNGKFKAGKSTTFEGGVRVPWLVWSGNKDLVPAGVRRSQQINATDFYPTALEAAGIRTLNANVDGLSWWKAIRDPKYDIFSGANEAKHARVVHIPGYTSRKINKPNTSIRSGRWKATYFYERGTWALYDVQADPGERRNLAPRHPAVVEKLAKLTLNWARVHRPDLAWVRTADTVVTLENFTGAIYEHGRVRRVRNAYLTYTKGEQVPLLVPSSFWKQRKFAVRQPWDMGPLFYLGWLMMPSVTR